MPERLSNLGYCMIKKETTKGTAVVPNVTIPLFSDTLTTDPHLDESTPIIGNKAARHRNYMGQATVMGDLSFLAEPNSLGYFLDMLLTKGTTTGAGPYTHPFTLSATTNPNSYTVEILRGRIPYRYYGVEASQLGISFDTNKGVATVSVSARGCFSAADITGVSTNTLTLNSAYTSTPTKGLVNGDLVSIYDISADAYIDTTISSLTDTTVTVAAAGAAASGDVLTLRALTPALSILDPILWSRSEYRFGATASAALSATHTPIEADSGEYTIFHRFNNDGGEMRSGSYAAASLARTVGDVEITTRHFFDSPDNERDMLTLAKNALVARHFVGTQYEFRVTMNNLAIVTKPNGLSSNELIYDEITWRLQYDDSDAQMFSVSVINNVPVI